MKSVSRGSVLLVDPDRFLRTFLVDALEHSGFKIFNSVNNSSEALSGFELGKVQVVLLELDLGDSVDGYNLAHSLRAIDPNIGIVFLTTSQDSRFMTSAGSIRPKGSRYLVKAEIDSVPQIISVVAQTMHKPFYENVNLENSYVQLTNLQVEIWKEVASGDSSSKIALLHNISEKAVEGTLARIYLILGIKKNKQNNPRVLLSDAFSQFQGKI